MKKKGLSRRTFLTWMGAAGGLASLQVAPKAFALAPKTKRPAPPSFLDQFGPIDPAISLPEGAAFLGERPERKAHPILRDKENFLKTHKLPAPREEVPLVIVGGGMSGLITAYLLRAHNPILLEQAPRLGGNAKGEIWNGVPYSVGAAYYMEQTPDTELYKLFAEVGAHKICKIKRDEDPVLLGRKQFKKFWDGETDPANKKVFLLLAQFFKDVFNETNQRKFPEMPLPVSEFKENLEGIAYLKDLDGHNFKDYLEKKVLKGETLHPHIEALLEHYCWSTFASPLAQVSAATGLNAYACEFGEVYVAPGGNSAVAECFLKKILEQVPTSHLRTDSLVVDVVAHADHTVVTYSDAAGELRSIKARAAVMACPKFVVKHILRDIEPERLAAIGKLKYHSYLVANALIDLKMKKSFYDLYLLDGGVDPSKAQVTDAILANYSDAKKSSSSVLTLYRGFPHDEGRSQMYAEESFGKFKSEIEAQLYEQILPALNVKKEAVKSLRITRWGHPMPVPTPGLIVDGTIEMIRRPFKKRVFFVEQDNWMLAAIETAAEEALFWSQEIEGVLKA